MSEQDVEIVRRMYEAYLAGDADRAMSFIHPDVRADFSVRGDTRIRRGREALAANVATWVGTWDGYSETVDEVRDLGDKICLIGKQRGRGKGSGVEIENEFAQLYEVEDGLITSLTMYMSVSEALEAAQSSTK